MQRLFLAFGWFIPHTGGHVPLKPFAFVGDSDGGKGGAGTQGLGFLSLIIEHSLGLWEGECDSYFVSSLPRFPFFVFVFVISS